MPAYHAINGDAERNDGRPSSANSSQRGSRYAEPAVAVSLGIANNQGQATVRKREKRGGRNWAGQLVKQHYQSGQYKYGDQVLEGYYTADF